MKSISTKVPFLFILLSLSIYSHAQSPEVLARAAFVSAQEYYGNGEFKAAIEKLNQVKIHLNGTNPRVDHLLTLSYAEMGEVASARASLKSYFDLASDTDPNYMEMLGMVDKLEKLDQKNAVMAIEQNVWKKTLEVNSPEEFHKYLLSYPNGKNVTEAIKGRTGLHGDNLTDPRDGKTYKTVYFGNYLWMAEDLRYELEGYSQYSKKYDQYTYQAYVSKNDLCPPGWHIPTIDELYNSLTTIGLSQSLNWIKGKAVSNNVYTSDIALITDRTVLEQLILSNDWGMSVGNNKSNLRIKPIANEKYSTLLLKGNHGQFHVINSEMLSGSFTQLTGPEGVYYNFDNGDSYYGTCRCIKD